MTSQANDDENNARKVEDLKMRLTDEILEDLNTVYATLSNHHELSVVAFGVVADYLHKQVGLTMMQAVDLIHHFPEFINAARRLAHEKEVSDAQQWSRTDQLEFRRENGFFSPDESRERRHHHRRQHDRRR